VDDQTQRREQVLTVGDPLRVVGDDSIRAEVCDWDRQPSRQRSIRALISARRT
jgi:hypothetical protein